MNREDAIQFLTDTGISPEHIMELVEALSNSEKPNKWINAEVLDKIRAEIEAKCCITVGRENDGAITLHDVFEIIDKYKTSPAEAESEE